MLVQYWSLLLFFNLDMTHDWHVYFLHISGLNLIFIFSNEVFFCFCNIPFLIFNKYFLEHIFLQAGPCLGRKRKM